MARSDKWRVKRSAIPEIEGANILKSLGKFIGMSQFKCDLPIRFHSTNSFIKFEKMRKMDAIYIRARFDSFPTSGENVDLMVSSALHEAMHYKIGSRKIYSNFKKLIPKDHPFWYFLNIGEDIFNERMLSKYYPNLVEYRQLSLEHARQNKIPYNKDSLLETWCEIELFGNTDALFNMPLEMRPYYSHLQTLSTQLMEKFSDFRTANYRTAWDAIKEYVMREEQTAMKSKESKNRTPEKREDTGSSKDGQQESADNGEGDETENTAPSPSDAEDASKDGDSNQDTQHDQDRGQSIPNKAESQNPLEPSQPKEYMKTPDQHIDYEGQDLDPHLEERMQVAVEKEEEDITEEINEFLESNGICPTNIYNSITVKLEKSTEIVKPDPSLVRKLSVIMSIKKRLQARVTRGEPKGTIDKRRLHRAVMDGKVFKQSYKFPSEFPKSAILVDASGSISEKQSMQITKAASAMSTLVKCDVYGYQGIGGSITIGTKKSHIYKASYSNKVHITKLNEPNVGVHVLAPGGNTPSGEAIAAVSRLLPKGGLLIHLTDGKHNNGISPKLICPIVEKELGVNVVHLIWGNSGCADDKFSELSYEQIGGLENFPEALHRVLIQELKIKI